MGLSPFNRNSICSETESESWSLIFEQCIYYICNIMLMINKFDPFFSPIYFLTFLCSFRTTNESDLNHRSYFIYQYAILSKKETLNNLIIILYHSNFNFYLAFIFYTNIMGTNEKIA